MTVFEVDIFAAGSRRLLLLILGLGLLLKTLKYKGAIYKA